MYFEPLTLSEFINLYSKASIRQHDTIGHVGRIYGCMRAWKCEYCGSIDLYSRPIKCDHCYGTHWQQGIAHPQYAHLESVIEIVRD